jgi:threonylcarbamoyladenosine tRNA methylthiotransferase MtaB
MTVEVLTFGCRLNAYESEVIRGHAAAAALSETVVVNTCAVTAEAERQARQAIRRAHRERPAAAIVVTGCAAQIDPARWAVLPGVTRVLGNAEKLEAAHWRHGAPGAVGDIMLARETAPHLVDGFGGRARAFLEVQQGCDHRCTFCIIPFGRGPSRSVPMGAIAQRARALVASGYQEIVLTGVDLTSYGPDLPGAPTLGQMVRRLLASVPDLRRLRLSSLDPHEIDADLWRLIETEGRLMPHLHLSLQSGSDLILKRMKRRHTRDESLAVMARARAARPGVAIGADLIAGFPTETVALFQQTLDLVRDADLALLHVFPYSARPGTPAARMPPVPSVERRARAATLRAAAAANAARLYAGLIGRDFQVLAEASRAGHTEHYLPARLTRDMTPGQVTRARVVAAAPDHLLMDPA